MTDRFGAATLSLAAALLASACGGEGADGGPTGPAPSVLTTIAVSPGSATLTAIGDSHQFSAAPLDQHSQAMAGVTFTWTSSDEAVATVDTAGRVIATGNGEATIKAAASGKEGAADITVAQTSDSVAVEPAEATFAAPGVQIQFRAVAEDANGHPLAAHRFSWSSTDTGVVSVSAAGLATAQALGQAAIVAEVGPVSGEAQVGVEPGEEAYVVAVSPDPLVEGEAATVSGGNFNPRPTDNVVRVDGVEAEVTAATETELRIVVPTFPCRPTRPAQVTVTKGADTTPPRPAMLSPGREGLRLSVGEHLLIEDPDAFCFRFDAAPAQESYLIGVQSTSELGATITEVRITSDTGLGAGGSAHIGPSAVLSLTPSGSSGGLRSPGRAAREVPERWRAHREAEARLRAWERDALLGPGAPPPLAGGRLRAHPAPDGNARLHVAAAVPEVGDILRIRVPSVLSTDLCTNYREILAVVRRVGARAVWLEDADNPDDGFTAADFESLNDRFDGPIYGTNAAYLGTPTDVDGNGRILILVTKELNRLPGLLGFVYAGDFFPRSICDASNEAEIFYGRAPEPTRQFGPPYPVASARGDYPPLIAHELAHVIQLGRRIDRVAPLMDTWMMEGQATLLEEVVGHAVTGRGPGNRYGHAEAYNTSGDDDIFWYRNAFDDLTRYFGFQGFTVPRVAGAPEQCGWLRVNPSPCLSRALWYGVGWSFLRWISDQFGPGHPGGEAGLHRALVSNHRTGFELLSAVTGETKERKLAWWAATLYADGRVEGGDPKLGKTSWDLLDIFRNVPAQGRLEPLALGFFDFQATGFVRAGSAGYLRLDGTGRPETAVGVRAEGGGALPADMQVWLVRLE